jgi:hypothetical protein
MSGYVFRFPANYPLFDYASLNRALSAVCDHPECYLCDLKVGTTVTVQRAFANVLRVRLYGFPVAYIGTGAVTFLPDGDDGHMATKAWIELIARHNGINGWIGRRRRRKADGPGPWTSRGMAGVLEISAEPAVHGTFPVDVENRHLWHTEEGKM